MTTNLDTLPLELCIRVIEKLSKADLKALSLVSKKWYSTVVQSLWECVTIKPWSEYRLDRISNVAALPQPLVQLARRLHFRQDFRYATQRRCPHHQDAKPWLLSDDDETDGEEDHAELDNRLESGQDDEFGVPTPRFSRLTQNAESVLGRLRDNQLHSFSWDLGTCVPSKVLGSQGRVPLNNPSLRSLSLTTDLHCYDVREPGCEIDLSALRQLQSLRWRAPRAWHLDTLSTAIRNSAERLEKLELDFVSWPELQDDLGFDSDDEEAPRAWCARNVFGLTTRALPQPIFPAIRELSLTQVPLKAAMARAINFDTLTSLTLRRCPSWCDFLKPVLELSLSIRLKRLEIQDGYDLGNFGLDGSWVTQDFLGAFEGLEELFIIGPEPEDTLVLWNLVAHHHHATLKEFVHHVRTVNLDEGSPYFEEECDLADLCILPRDLRRIRQDPLQNPLSRLELDFLGLCCGPELLRGILLPFTSKTSLKVLHIRQSRSDLSHYASWAADPSVSGVNPPSGDAAPAPSEGEEHTQSHPSPGTHVQSPVMETDDDIHPELRDILGLDDSSTSDASEDASLHHPMLRPEFSRFAEWVFGPQGVGSLQLVAFGDFAYGGRIHLQESKLILCRSLPGGREGNSSSNFRIISEYDPEAMEILDEYRDALEAGPMEPLLEP